MAAVEHNEPAALSEVESLSDSDWLEVDSSRESEDNDSILDESDAEPDRPFRSRASSTSAPSPPQVDRWEGFIEGATGAGDGLQGTRPSSPPSPGPDRGPTSPLARNVLATEEDLVEDERVCHALDQSMASTLGSSRSSHGSCELRLSFPDPMKSSQDDLNRSYEDVAPSEAGDTAPPSDIEQTDLGNITMTSLASTPSTDIGSLSAPDVPSSQENVIENPSCEEIPTVPQVMIPEEAREPGAPLGPDAFSDVKQYDRPTKDHLPRLHVTTIVAILSLALGYMMTGSMPNPLSRSSGVAVPPPSATSAKVDNSVNLTLAVTKSKLETSESGSLALVASSMSDFALSIIKPTTSALALRPSTDASLALVASGSGTSDVALTSCAYVSSPSKYREVEVDVPSSSAMPTISAPLSVVDTHSSSSLSVIPSTTSSLDVQSSLPRVKRDFKGKGKAVSSEPSIPSPTMGLSKHVILNALDAHLRAIGDAIASDMQDLVHALDELTRALVDAGATVGQHGRALGQAGVARAKQGIRRARDLRSSLRDNFRGRHGRAKESAQALKTVGRRWIIDAGHVGLQLYEGARARVRGQTETARRNAKMIRGERAARKERRARRARTQEKQQTVRRDGHNQRVGTPAQV